MQVFIVIILINIFITKRLQVNDCFYICHMIDEKKLKTVNNYAKKRGFHRNWIYQLIHKGKVKLVEIDGVKFVKDEDR